MTYSHPVLSNPFRLLGLFADARDRELVRQSTRIPQFLEVGEEVSFEADFLGLGELSRTLDRVNESARRLENGRNRMHAALFWLVRDENQDKMFDKLSSHDLAGAVSELRNVQQEGGSAALNNLSTLLLVQAARVRGSFDRELFEEALQLKAALLTSPEFPTFASSLNVGIVSSVSDEDIELFVETVVDGFAEWIDVEEGLSSADLVSVFEGVDARFSHRLLDRFAGGPAQVIESEIARAREALASDPWDADYIGDELYESTRKEMAILRRVVDSDDVRSEAITNKLVTQLNLCALTFFNTYQESDLLDPGAGAIRLLKVAKAYRPTGEAATVVQEGEGVVRNWIASASIRGKGTGFEGDFKTIRNKVQRFRDSVPANSKGATSFVLECFPMIDRIGKSLGPEHPAVIDLSSRVVGAALSMSVESGNRLQSDFRPDLGQDLLIRIVAQVKEEVTEALRMILTCERLSIDPLLRQRLEENKRTLKEILRGFHVFTEPSVPNLPRFNPPATESPRPAAEPRGASKPAEASKVPSKSGQMFGLTDETRIQVLNYAIGFVVFLMIIILAFGGRK